MQFFVKYCSLNLALISFRVPLNVNFFVLLDDQYNMLYSIGLILFFLLFYLIQFIFLLIFLIIYCLYLLNTLHSPPFV
jgi:hypothetical protein